MKRFLRIVALQALQYGLIVLNTRCIVVRSYLGLLASDGLIAFNGIVLTKFVIQAKGPADYSAYVVGGMLGSLLALVASPWLEARL